MRRLFVSFFLICSLAASLVAQQPGTPADKAIAITHVTVINPKSASVKRDMTVVIRGDRIVAVRRSRIIETIKGATTIDAAGKVLIPGLWDMHVHIGTGDFEKQQMLRLLITQGVTGIRVMNGRPRHRLWRQEIERGDLLGPRMVIASRIIAGPTSFAGGAVKVNNAEEARAAARQAKNEDADFIKVHDGLSRESYFAIIDEAKKLAVTVAGHVPESITAAEAANAGQKSIEHFTGLNEAANDSAKADALIPILKKNHTWLCPTLIMIRNYSVLNDPSLANDPRLRYLNQAWKGWWLDMTRDASKMPATEWAARREIVRKGKALFGRFQQGGVQILAGTDDSNPFVVPGFGLHDELEMLVESGLSPMQALRAATINPARFFQKTATLGSVETGKLADFVLLNANPLEDIRNTTKIYAVVLNGRVLERKALDEIMSEIEAAARQN
jgi:imidazolonepropionase-like amidohydrolase